MRNTTSASTSLVATLAILTASILAAPLAARAQIPVPPGWIAGDLHAHHPDSCLGVAGPAEIIAGMPGDLAVAAVLLWGGGGYFEQQAAQYFTGAVDPLSTPSKIIKYDLELSGFLLGDRMGHLAGIGLTDIDFPQSTYLAPIQDWVHAQGAIVGSLHSQAWTSSFDEFPPLEFCCGPYELPVSMAHGRVDYLDYQGPFEFRWRFIWYALLNCGFRPGLAATSDSWCLGPMGSYKTYARIDGPLTYEAYAQAVADGRVTVVEGNEGFMHFEVEGVEAGDELGITAGQEVEMTATFILPPNTQRLGTMQIVKNGANIGFRSFNQVGGTVELTITDTPGQSSWYAARIDKSHSGAIFTVIDGQPIRASVEAAQYFIDYMDYLRDAIDSGFFYQLTPEDQAALEADIDSAEIIYTTIRDEAASSAGLSEPAPSSAVPALVRAYPVPFSRSLRIDAGRQDAGEVRLEIYTSGGRRLRSMTSSHGGGVLGFDWDGRDSLGHDVPNGIYYFRLQTDDAGTVGLGRVVRVR